MRIIAGAARGRRLTVPRGEAVRPTADRTREALFSSLAPRLPGAHVVDLYAGAGGLGLEALSRGAASVTFVEQARPALAALRHNIEVVGVPGAHVVAGTLPGALGRSMPGAPFELALLDPPYALDERAVAAVLVALVPLLAADAEVVVERASRAPAPPWPAALRPRQPRRYGAATLHRAERVAEPAGGPAG